jgi:putative transposase
MDYAPTVRLPALVNSLKGVSSRVLRQQRPDIVRRYWKNVLRSPSYFAASCGGAPLDIIRRDVGQQRQAG